MAAKAKTKKAAAKPKKKAAAKPKKKAAAKRKAAKPKKAAAALILKRVIVQFTRNGRNVGRPQLAPRGADDVHFVWKNPPGVFVRAWWTRGGRRIKLIPVPRYANDVHVRIR